MSFSNILGQERVVNTLKEAVRRRSLAPSYIFFGPDGVGKKFTAITLAKAINCRDLSDDSCDLCKYCKLVENGSHPNVILTDPSGSSIGIDEIRSLQRLFTFKVFCGGKKIGIINDAEKMTLQAANSLLKILEEPPGDTHFVLITSNPYRLAPTILSRCQKLRFIPLKESDVFSLLKTRMKVPENKARILSQLSQGSLEKAISLESASFLKIRQNLSSKILNSDERSILEALRLAQSLVSNKEELVKTLEWLETLYRDLLLLKIDKEMELFTINRDLPLKKGFERDIGISELLGSLDSIRETRKNILSRNANSLLAMELLFLKLFSPGERFKKEKGNDNRERTF